MMSNEQEMIFLGILQILLFGKTLMINIQSLLRIAAISVWHLPQMDLIHIGVRMLVIAFGPVYVYH
jgi:hypothetical protein